MTSAQSAAQQAAQLHQQNATIRSMMLQTSPVFRKDLGTNTEGTLGGSARIKLYNVGLLKRLILQVTMTVDIGTANATLSNKGPYNLLNRIRLTDYSGTDRVNISGAHMFIVNCARERRYVNYNNESAAAVYTDPNVPLTTGTGKTLSFSLEVPICYSESDTRGIINMQTSEGEMYLTLDFNSTLVSNGNDDAVYNGASTTTVAQSSGTTIDVNVIQEYYSPQADASGHVYLPPIDAMTIYSLDGTVRSSDNLIANAERLISLQNMRSVVGVYIGFLQNGLMDSTNVSRHRVITNGNNVVQDWSNFMQLREQRRWANSDTRPGQYMYLFRVKPIETALLGNCQIGFTPSAVSGTTNIEITQESFYTTGQLLPGMAQAQ